MLSSERNELAAQMLHVAIPSHTGWSRANCLICPLVLGKPDRKQGWAINTRTGGWHCFRCGTSGRLREIPDGFAPLDAVVTEEDCEALHPPDKMISLGSEPGRSALCLRSAREYLYKRKLTPKLIEEACIGACLDGRWAGRVIVPIFDNAGVWRGWVGRTWYEHADRTYLYPSGMRRADLLYNGHVLAEQTDAPVLVVEGVFDALALWPHAVAVLGKPSNAQIDMLAAAARPVAIVLDGDAHEEGWALAMRLRFRGCRAGSVRLEPRVDPDEVPKTWLLDQARQCLDS